MKKRAFAFLLSLLGTPAYAFAQGQARANSPPAVATPLPVAAFAYAPDRPFDPRVAQRRNEGSTSVEDLSFAAAAGAARIHANLVLPSAPNGSAVLFVHWLGDDPKATNLGEFMPDALALAAKGTTSLLIDAPWAQAGWFEKIRTPAGDYGDSIAEVVNLRRSLDVLLGTPHVDAHKLAYVGHDFGAMYGAVLSGVDPRPAFYVLAAGTTTFSEWFLLGPKPADQAAYVASMAPLDPLAYVARSHARGYLVQFARSDEYIPLAKARAFAAAVPDPKAVVFYDGDHSLAIPQAREERVAWLNARFGQ